MKNIPLKYTHVIQRDKKCADCGSVGMVACNTHLPDYGICINWNDYADPNKSLQNLFCIKCTEKRITRLVLEDSDKGGYDVDNRRDRD